MGYLTQKSENFHHKTLLKKTIFIILWENHLVKAQKTYTILAPFMLTSAKLFAVYLIYFLFIFL